MIEDISSFLLYIAPGFIAIEIYRYFYPSRKRDSYIYFAQSAIIALAILSSIKFIDTSICSNCFHSNNTEPPDLKLTISLLTSGVTFGLLLAGQLKIRSMLALRFEGLSWLTSYPDDIWVQINSPNNEDWAVVYVDDGSIYRGWIKRYQFDPNLEDQDFLLSKASRVDENLNEIYRIDGIGIYLNTSVVKRIEFFKGVS